MTTAAYAWPFDSISTPWARMKAFTFASMRYVPYLWRQSIAIPFYSSPPHPIFPTASSIPWSRLQPWLVGVESVAMSTAASAAFFFPSWTRPAIRLSRLGRHEHIGGHAQVRICAQGNVGRVMYRSRISVAESLLFGVAAGRHLLPCQNKEKFTQRATKIRTMPAKIAFTSLVNSLLNMRCTSLAYCS